MRHLIEMSGIRKTYRLGDVEVPVLKDVSLFVEPGEFVAVMGASGSGKSTLMNIVGCLDRPTSGSYRLDGREVASLSRDERARMRNSLIGFVFQNFNLLARTSALDNVLMPLAYSDVSLPRRETIRRATSLLERMGLADRLHHFPSQLSGGQQQRVAIARSLVCNPRLLLADEPTGNLDSRTSADVLQLLESLNRDEGITVVLITHDPNVGQHAQRMIRISDGSVVE